MRLIVAAALVAALPLAAASQDDDPKALALKARQGYFQMLNANMGILAGMAKGEIAYEENQAVRAATNIEALTGYDPSMHFLEGTSASDLSGRTAARPEIWTDNAGFLDKYAGLQKAVEGAPDAVRGGQANVAATVQKIGTACKACHDNYRVK